MAWIVGMGVVVAVAILLFGRSVLRQSRALGGLAADIARLRALASAHPRFTPVGQEEGPAPELDSAAAGLEVVGLRVLGDFWEERPDGSRAGRTRWVADGAGNVCGWMGVTVEGPALLLLSELEGERWVITYQGPEAPLLDMPETVRRATVPSEGGVAPALEAHRRACGEEGAPPARLLDVEDAEGAQNLVRRLRAHVAGWRGDQPYDALLESDLRRLMGPRFDDLGSLVMDEVRVLERRDGASRRG